MTVYGGSDTGTEALAWRTEPLAGRARDAARVDEGLGEREHGLTLVVSGLEQLHDERGVRQGTDAKICSAAIHRYCSKILDNIDDITSVERFYLDDAETVIVAYGSVSRSALSAVNRARAEGLRVGMLKLNTVWPVPEKEIREACAGAKRVIVPEMNVGQYIREEQRVVGMDKVVGFSSIGGAFPHPSAIYSKIVEVE